MANTSIVILGSGIAGIYAALKLSPLPVMMISPFFRRGSGSSYLAQGGIAAAIGMDDDPALHWRDTVNAGAGLVDESVAHAIIYAAPGCIRDLEALGVMFDKDASGNYALAKEAAHSRARVLHLSGDGSGARLMEHLQKRLKAASHVKICDGNYAISIDAEGGAVGGVWLLGRDRMLRYQPARAVILATGGIGGLYYPTTNPPLVRGQGLGMAALAGATIMDSEFVQFHPTALATGDDPVPLITEALRGAGALLLTEAGEYFMAGVHQDRELAPRDIVARAVYRRIRSGNRVYLDARRNPGDKFLADFPQVHASCMKAGIDPLKERIPIVPAAHYHIGGVAVTDAGISSIPGLYANGEVACTGMHGANRLASNSLLEGLVMSDRIANHIKNSPALTARHIDSTPPRLFSNASAEAWSVLRKTATQNAGIVRNGPCLKEAQSIILQLMERWEGDLRFTNACMGLLAVVDAALNRKESRGCHFREDYQSADPAYEKHTKLVWVKNEFIECNQATQ